MDSDKSEEEHEVISKQIIDYYRKYSQNKQLPKYFTGTSLSYMPQIVKEDEIRSPTTPTIIVEDVDNLSNKEPNLEIEEITEVKVSSPTCSITSNRKLEWDNGADIGYINYEIKTNLHKSTSLPVLVDNINDKKVDLKHNLTSKVLSVISYSSNEDNPPEKQIYSSSSSSSYQPEIPVESSTSTVITNPKQYSSSSSSLGDTMAYLKNKIGIPNAESTPKVNIDSKKINIPEIEEGSKTKIINLCWTKPITVECLNTKSKKMISDKNVQTSLCQGQSKSIQTGDSLEVLFEKTIDDLKSKICEKPSNQSIIIINHDTESDKKTSSTNMTDDVASQCDSFEYYQNNKVTELKGESVKSASTDVTDSSKEIPILGQLITQKQSENVIKDVDRSIEILQKLLKSKKYDPATKRRYIKKIVDKIVDNKYSEDSATSSELFIPKKQNEKQEGVALRAPQISKFTVKTFSDEFLPKELVNTSEDNPSSNLDTSPSLEKQQVSSSGSCQTWKEDKTLSEKLYEEKQKGQGDHLVKFAMKERQHQLSWINHEISHLTKLKGLLEKKVHRTTTVYMLSNIVNDDRCACPDPLQKPSRNYVIETEISGSSSSSRSVDYRLRDENGTRTYHLKELTPKKPQADISKRVERDIEILSDDNSTNIKVKTRDLEPRNEDVFQSRHPTLVGIGKYETFPRSKTEYRSGLDKTEAFGANGQKKYSFEIPLTGVSNIEGKINEIINKYIAKPTTTYVECKCTEASDSANSKKSLKIEQVKSSAEEAVSPKIPCSCCRKIHDSIKQQTTETQTSRRSSEQSSKKIAAGPLHNKNAQSLDKSVQCKCGCQCTEAVQTDPKTNQNEKGIQNGEKYTILVPIDGESSHEKVLPCKCGCKCAEAAMKKTVATDLESVECCCNKGVQTSLQTSAQSRESMSSSTSSSSVSSDSVTSISGSARSCLCCKQKNVSSKYLYYLKKKLSEQAYPLCRPCYRQNRRFNYPVSCYKTPGHVCNCYTVVQTKTLNEIKKTINDLNDLDSQYCQCLDVDNRGNSDYCKYCKCKLKKTSRSKNGIAYMITFENDHLSREKKKKKHKKKGALEEIKIKIPVTYKKRHKDKENKRKKAERLDDSGETSSSGSKKNHFSTLQEYLKTNRPDFVDDAEGRRRTVQRSKMQREEMSDQKKMLFLEKCKQECEKHSKRLFSEKEMKEITRRNYRKLPEVQKKLTDNREKQLRQANRLIADTFNKKLRENVLKGKKNLPTDVNVVNL